MKDHVDVDQPAERVVSVLAVPESLARFARQAEDAPGHISVGRPCTRGRAVLIPFRWETSPGPDLSLTFEADLEVLALDDRHSQVSMSCTFPRPPGRSAADRGVQRRAARTVRRFLDGVAGGVAARAGTR